MSQPTKEWEKEFEKQFKNVLAFNDIPSGGQVIKDLIKYFISTLLSSALKEQRKNIRGEIEEATIIEGNKSPTIEEMIGYNKANIDFLALPSLQDPTNIETNG